MRIYKFSTPSCTWCKVVAPHVEEYAKANNLEIIEVNADAEEGKDQELTIKHNVMGVPVVILADEGAVTQKLTGFQEIMSFVKE